MQEREKRARLSKNCFICSSAMHPPEKCPKKCLCGGLHTIDSHSRDNCLGCLANTLFVLFENEPQKREEKYECLHFPFSAKTKILIDRDVSQFVKRFLAQQQ